MPKPDETTPLWEVTSLPYGQHPIAHEEPSKHSWEPFASLIGTRNEGDRYERLVPEIEIQWKRRTR